MNKKIQEQVLKEIVENFGFENMTQEVNSIKSAISRTQELMEEDKPECKDKDCSKFAKCKLCGKCILHHDEDIVKEQKADFRKMIEGWSKGIYKIYPKNSIKQLLAKLGDVHNQKFVPINDLFPKKTSTCKKCGFDEFDHDRIYCKYCGSKLKKDGVGFYCKTGSCSWFNGGPCKKFQGNGE